MLILTKYLGPTNHRGSRIKATLPHYGASVTVSWDYSLSGSDAQARAAATELCRRFNAGPDVEFSGQIVKLRLVGALPGADGYAFSAETATDGWKVESL